ncbi:MAG TPA: prenyltransferase [Polyangia bacterium]|nr:prenyltransferase [Polyangia bacterium]
MSARAGRAVLAFVRLGRPQFLAGGFVLYGLGAALAALAGSAIDRRRYVWGQLAVTAVQLMTHYCNDYFDLAADQANATPTRWSGGSRVLPDGGLPAVVALWAAVVLAGVALAAAVVLVRAAGAPAGTVPLLLVMLFLAWEYSAPPLRLHSRGLGELTTAVVVTLSTPLFAFYLQAGQFSPLPFLAVLPLCAFQFAMLLAIEFPDAAGDATAGKRTLVVRLGAPRAAILHQLAMAAAYLTLPLLVVLGLPPIVAIAAAAPAPLAAWQAWQMRQGLWREQAGWEKLGFSAVVVLIGSAACELAAVLWAIRRGA